MTSDRAQAAPPPVRGRLGGGVPRGHGRGALPRSPTPNPSPMGRGTAPSHPAISPNARLHPAQMSAEVFCLPISLQGDGRRLVMHHLDHEAVSVTGCYVVNGHEEDAASEHNQCPQRGKNDEARSTNSNRSGLLNQDGIRTRGTFSGTPVSKAGAFNHSATCPNPPVAEPFGGVFTMNERWMICK